MVGKGTKIIDTLEINYRHALKSRYNNGIMILQNSITSTTPMIMVKVYTRTYPGNIETPGDAYHTPTV